MATFDETDLEILRLLLADGRRPYSDIAEAVDLSPPAVSDRIDRLREQGVIRRVTVDLDRSQLTGGTQVLIVVRAEPTAVRDVREALAAREEVEHVFTTADAGVFVKAFVPDGDVRALLAESVDLDDVMDYDVHMLTDADWTPGLGSTEFDIECAECGNRVTAEGETVELGGDRYHFCCGSCEARFVERYRELAEGTD